MADVLKPRLTPRQEDILAHVVHEYVATGGPVGSKTLVEHAALEVSPSTVRYELAVLEERGLLTHPHTSAGRMPTDLGYRFFVDRLLKKLAPRPAELDLDLSTAESQVDSALRATTEALAELTHLLALVSAPPLGTTTVRHVEVLLLQPHLAMVVVITSTGGVTKRLCAFEEPVDSGLAEWAGQYLNETVSGLQPGARLVRASFEDPALTEREREFLAHLRPAFNEVLEPDEQTLYIGGTAGVLGEFRADELRGYRRLLKVLEQRAALLDLRRSASSRSARSCASAPSSRIPSLQAFPSSERRTGSSTAIRDGQPARADADGLRLGHRRGALGRPGALAVRGRLYED